MILDKALEYVDPYVRPAFDRLFQRRLANAVQRLIVARRTDDDALLGEETLLPDEAARRPDAGG